MAKNVILTDVNNHQQEQLESISEWYSNRNWGFYTKIVEYCYKSIKPYFRPNRLLEIGPADGAMTQLMINDFSSITVVDAAKRYIDQVTKIDPKITGHVSLIENFTSNERFDTIVMAHILEHITDPTAVLKHVSKLLAPKGHLIIVVPNANSLHRQVGVKMNLLNHVTDLNDADISVDHKRVYTQALLTKHARQAGLSISKSGGIYLKPLSNQQIDEHWPEELMDAFYELGKDYPSICSELFIVCKAQ